MQTVIEKAAVLIEALPYIQDFRRFRFAPQTVIFVARLRRIGGGLLAVCCLLFTTSCQTTAEKFASWSIDTLFLNLKMNEVDEILTAKENANFSDWYYQNQWKGK